MAPLIVLLVTFPLFLLLSRLGVRPLREKLTALRWSLAAMFLLTASAHWGPLRADLVRMVPPAFPNPELLVTLTGIAELFGVVGLLIPRFARWAALGLALLLLAMFPANIYAALHELSINGQRVWGVFPRGLLQLFFLGALLVAARRGSNVLWRRRVDHSIGTAQ